MTIAEFRNDILPILGHRNWVAVVDAAFPQQVAEGLSTYVIDGDHNDVVSQVREAIDLAPHVRGDVLLDAEIDFLTEGDLPGIGVFRDDLFWRLHELPLTRMPHERLLKQIDETARMYRVVFLKTNCTLPYTSVFFRLECGYWGAEAEVRLRNRMPPLL